MTEKPLGFSYQFAAGAIAGVSEVRSRTFICCDEVELRVDKKTTDTDSHNVSSYVRLELRTRRSTRVAWVKLRETSSNKICPGTH